MRHTRQTGFEKFCEIVMNGTKMLIDPIAGPFQNNHLSFFGLVTKLESLIGDENGSNRSLCKRQYLNFHVSSA